MDWGSDNTMEKSLIDIELNRRRKVDMDRIRARQAELQIERLTQQNKLAEEKAQEKQQMKPISDFKRNAKVTSTYAGIYGIANEASKRFSAPSVGFGNFSNALYSGQGKRGGAVAAGIRRRFSPPPITKAGGYVSDNPNHLRTNGLRDYSER